MLQNYIKIAWRNLMKNKTFSFINIFGLSIGLACCMLISIYVYDELNYDKYPEHAKNIYRVEVSTTGNGSIDTYPNVDIAVGEGMKKAFPEVQGFTRLTGRRPTFVKYGDKQFKEDKLSSVDPNFLQFFSIPLIEGDHKTALNDPTSIVITKAFSKKYFGNESPLGKFLTIGISSLKVTGVIDKVPDNSHFHFDAFMRLSFPPTAQQTWSNVGFYTYLILNDKTDIKKLESKFPDLVAKYVVPEVKHDMGVSLAEAQKSVNTFRFSLMPLLKIHLYSNTKYELEANGDIQYVYIFSALAIFILLLACVNFTNLSTASSAKRAREVGIHKVMGSGKKELIYRFLAESILLTYCAIIVALLIVYLLLPYFQQVSGKHATFGFFINSWSVIVLLLLGLVVGVSAGLYPAFFLSAFKTIQVLKSASSTSTRQKSPLRSTLVVFQFAVSTGLIIATMVVYQQLHYMQDKKLGYDKEQIVYLQDTYTLGNMDIQEVYKQTLLKDSRVINASITADIPGNTDMDGTQIYAKDKKASETNSEIHANIFHVDYDYLSTLGIRLREGRNFSKDFSTDSFAVIINQAAVRDLGWSNTNPIGKTIVTSGQHEFKVIGVTDDFHYVSVKQKIVPLMLEIGHVYRTGIIVKIKPADAQNLLVEMKKQWAQFNPGAPFTYYFLDDKFASLYAGEQKTGKIFTLFAIVAVLIACLGLFGLATYITQQRTKEIGIRKIFGASIQDILVLVSKEFIQLVVIACIITIPIAWWGMNSWLKDFAYRINITGWVFVLSGFIALMIALFTVSFQALKAALANPVKSLRTE